MSLGLNSIEWRTLVKGNGLLQTSEAHKYGMLNRDAESAVPKPALAQQDNLRDLPSPGSVGVVFTRDSRQLSAADLWRAGHSADYPRRKQGSSLVRICGRGYGRFDSRSLHDFHSRAESGQRLSAKTLRTAAAREVVRDFRSAWRPAARIVHRSAVTVSDECDFRGCRRIRLSGPAFFNHCVGLPRFSVLPGRDRGGPVWASIRPCTAPSRAALAVAAAFCSCGRASDLGCVHREPPGSDACHSDRDRFLKTAAGTTLNRQFAWGRRAVAHSFTTFMKLSTFALPTM